LHASVAKQKAATPVRHGGYCEEPLNERLVVNEG
jgi:hypothetical protein